MMPSRHRFWISLRRGYEDALHVSGYGNMQRIFYLRRAVQLAGLLMDGWTLPRRVYDFHCGGVRPWYGSCTTSVSGLGKVCNWGRKFMLVQNVNVGLSCESKCWYRGITVKSAVCLWFMGTGKIWLLAIHDRIWWEPVVCLFSEKQKTESRYKKGTYSWILFLFMQNSGRCLNDNYSTVTDLARFLGLSTSSPLHTAMW